MAIIKAPPKQPKTVTIQVRVEESVKAQLDRYAEFIDSSTSYVITEALKLLFKRDDEFKAWLDQQDQHTNNGNQEKPVGGVLSKNAWYSNHETPSNPIRCAREYSVLTTACLVPCMPCFGQRRLCDISKRDIQQFVADKFRQGLAWQTVRNAWIVLSSVLDAAVDYSYLNSNPARGVQIPLQGRRKEPRILNAEALAKLLAQLREPYRSMFILTALTGLRVGELLAPRWKMVDLTAGTIRVSESVFHGQVQLPKSERSIRTIPIGPQTRGVSVDRLGWC